MKKIIKFCCVLLSLFCAENVCVAEQKALYDIEKVSIEEKLPSAKDFATIFNSGSFLSIARKSNVMQWLQLLSKDMFLLLKNLTI